MRYVIIYLMTGSIMVQSMNFAFLYLSFKLNQDYIARNLCINKDKPEMNCHGRCQLTKSLQEKEQRESENPLKFEERNVVHFLSPASKFIFRSIIKPINKFHNFNRLTKATSYIADIFHPPKYPY